jgi:hypothetical protein
VKALLIRPSQFPIVAFYLLVPTSDGRTPGSLTRSVTDAHADGE